MKEYKCVEVPDYTTVAKVIQEHLAEGWHLHTYQATGSESTRASTHYLLFYKRIAVRVK